MTDADGADFPPETNPEYKEMHEQDFGLAYAEDAEADEEDAYQEFQDKALEMLNEAEGHAADDIAGVILSSDEMLTGLGEIDGSEEQTTEVDATNIYEDEDSFLDSLDEVAVREMTVEEQEAVKAIEKRLALAEALHELADLLAFDTELPLPDVSARAWIWSHEHYDPKAKLADIARRLGKVEKKHEGSFFSLIRRFGPIELEYTTSREAVCERVQVGTEYVPPRPATEGEYKPKYEWICNESLLSSSLSEDLHSDDEALD